jgi:hypothetical protein
MSENPPSKHPLWDGCLQSVQQACHLKMWSLGMWWYLAFWNAGKGRRLWTILINATGRYVSTPNFCVWPCLPFKCNQFWHIHSDVFCVDEHHWHVCQEWKREGVQQASILWHSNCRITLLAFIRTCIMIRKSWNILTMCENGTWCAHCRITPQAFIHQTCITVKKLWNILKQSVPSWHICSISFRASLPWCRFGGRWPVVLFYNEHSLHDFCKIGTLQVCMATFLVMLTVYRRHWIWSRRCPLNHMWLWSGWLMHVALVFVFVTMLLKTRRADKVSSAVWRIANFFFWRQLQPSLSN